MAAVKLSALLFSLTYVAMAMIRPTMMNQVGGFVLAGILTMLMSQILGRSLIKFGFEAALALVVLVSLVLRYAYRGLPDVGDVERLKFIYTEQWEILKISVPIVLFYLGTVGVTFAVQFLREQYFKGNEAMIQLQMFRYGVLFIYSIFGVVFLIYAPLIRRILILRAILLRGG